MTREEEWLAEYRVLQGLSREIVAARSANNIPELVRLKGEFARQIDKLKALSNAAERQSLSSFEHFLLDLEEMLKNVPGAAGDVLADLLKKLLPVLIVAVLAALLIYGGVLEKGLKR